MSQLVTESAGAVEQIALCERAHEEASSKPRPARASSAAEPTAAELETLARWGWAKLTRGYWKDPSSGWRRKWDAALRIIAKGEARGDLPGDVAPAESAPSPTSDILAGAGEPADDSSDYERFISAKRAEASSVGFEPGEISAVLFPFQRDVVAWAVRRGRAAIFASFGLGKSLMQLEIGRQVCWHTGGRFLIVAPLGVRQEFMRDAELIGEKLTFIRHIEDAGPTGLYITNYETVRDGKLDPRDFDGASLDEASCLRGFGGTKTFREFMALFAGDDRRDLSQRIKGEQVRYRFVATATPSPNEYIELLAYSAFLDVMDISTAKTRFFQRDSEHADELTIHPHKESEFWLWMNSWSIFITRPSDLGYADEGYALPELQVHWHKVDTDHRARAGVEKKDRAGRSQAKMFVDTAAGVVDASREARASLPDRIAKLMEIRAANPEAHRVIWHDLEAERAAIEKAIPSVRSVYGAQPLDEREATIIEFSDGKIQELAAKPVMLGSGCNFQRHCAEAVFLGITYKFNDFIQAVHRIHRFLQTRVVHIHIIYTEAQDAIRRALQEKWTQHNALVARMTETIRANGLAHVLDRIAKEIRDKTRVVRSEVTGERFTMVHNDCVAETRAMPENSVGQIVTSIPFSTQYKYSDSYLDFGHTDTNEHFWQQMGFLIPQLFKVLKPGRIAAIHVKDRIVPGGLAGLRFQTVYPFHCDAIAHFTRYGFAYMGMITVVTDVVRENIQTNRLGWSEQCKDATKMGVGMPEYILLFRKPPTGDENSYADEPVVKSKEEYSRGRWQVDAHAFHRSNGNRLLDPRDLIHMEASEVFQTFSRWSRENRYDFEGHVAVCNALDAVGKLPAGFMLLQPQSTNPDAWTDVARMRTLNTLQAAQERVQHLCPMQFDIAERLITRFSMPGEVVYDPFAGLGTVPYCAVKLKRRGLGTELSPEYFTEAVRYCRAIEARMAVPTLFDLDAAAATLTTGEG